MHTRHRSTVGVIRPQLTQRISPKNATASFRPLSNVARNVLVRSMPWASREVSGLNETGTVYIVEKGDTGSAIAKKLTGNAARWTELRAVNPKIMARGADLVKKYGFPIYVGDKVNLPSSWITVKPSPAVQPADNVPAPVVVPGGNIAALGQARVILTAWANSDGARQAGLSDYANASDLASTAWTARDVLMGRAFANWWTATGASPAVADGNWSDVLAQALNIWAENKAKRVTDSAAAGGGVVVPPLTPPVVVPASPSTSTPTASGDSAQTTPSVPIWGPGGVLTPPAAQGGDAVSGGATSSGSSAATAAQASTSTEGTENTSQKWAIGSLIVSTLGGVFIKALT
jgi:hypothetical protein